MGLFPAFSGMRGFSFAFSFPGFVNKQFELIFDSVNILSLNRLDNLDSISLHPVTTVMSI